MRFKFHRCLLPLLLSLFFGVNGAIHLSAQEHRDVIFYTGSGAVRWPLLTHLIWFDNSFIDTNSVFAPPTGTSLTGMLALRDQAHANGKKFMLGISNGINSSGNPVTNMMQNTALRATFVQTVSDFVLTNDLDGLDVDFEYPYSVTDQASMTTFFTDLRTALGQGPLVTADVADWAVQVPVATINSQLNWVNIMDYYHMTNTPSQLAFARTSLNTYTAAGVWPCRLVLGVAFAGKSPSGGYDVGYNSLVQFITPYNTAQDIVTNGSGTVYYLSGNQDTQRAKVDLAATNATGTMVWHLLADTTNETESLAVALNNERTNKIAVIDGFEYPMGASVDSIYRRSSCTLAVTNERAAGDSAIMATMIYNGAKYSGGNFMGPWLADGWSFPGSALLRVDVRPLDPVSSATFYLTLYDGHTNTASYYNVSTLLSKNQWSRLLLATNNFQTVSAGFNWNDIRQYRFLSQLSAAGTTSTNRLLVDNFVLFNPVATNRPTQTDLNYFTLSYAAGANGALAGATNQIVAYGGSGSAVIAQPAGGYFFSNWSDGSPGSPRVDTNVTGNISVTALFVAGNTNASIQLTGGSAALTFFGAGGVPCVFQRTTNLASGPWVNLATNTPATNGPVCWLDDFSDLGNVEPPAAFYRLIRP